MKKLLSAFIIAAGVSLSLSAIAGGGKMTKEMAAEMDENKDGMVSKEEYMKHSKDMETWTALDKNNNGMLEPTELGFQQKSQ